MSLTRNDLPQLSASEHKKRAKAVIQERDEKKHDVLSLPEPENAREIYMASAADLRRMLASRKISSADAVRVLAGRARRIGREQLNAVTEEFYEEAYQRAKFLDETVTPEQWQDIAKFPLLGVPISIKDSFHQKGAYSTCGMSVYCQEPKTDDGLLVELLRDAGAILFVRTNVPQCLMLPESMNNIWGTTVNPYNSERTVGGSSGGEAGLIAAFASPLGLGGDIGGSIRIPSHFCGIVGLKPSNTRMTRMGFAVPRMRDRNGQIAIQGAAGPMARTVEDCRLMMSALLADKCFQRDPYVPPVPFNNKIAETGLGRSLRIGVFTTDNWFQPSDAGVRAVKQTAEILKAAGHEVEFLELPPELDGWETARIYYAILGADGNMFSFLRALRGEPLHPYYNNLRKITKLPNFLRSIIGFILRYTGEHRRATLLGVTRSGGLPTRDFWERCADLNSLRSNWLKYFDDKKLDAIVCPGLGLPAFPHGYSRDLTPACSYTFLFNVLGWPAGTVPITVVRPSETNYPANENLPTNQRDSLAKRAREVMANAEGLPLGVQIATRPNQDELCLFVMGEIEKAVNWKGCTVIA